MVGMGITKICISYLILYVKRNCIYRVFFSLTVIAMVMRGRRDKYLAKTSCLLIKTISFLLITTTTKLYVILLKYSVPVVLILDAAVGSSGR